MMIKFNWYLSEIGEEGINEWINQDSDSIQQQDIEQEIKDENAE